MEINLLADGYKSNDNLYQDFLDDKLFEKDEYFSDEVVYIKNAPDFPIYMGKGSEEDRKKNFLQAFQIVSESYLDTDRDLLLDERFWHSLLLTNKRDFILSEYPEVINERSKFYNIVLKKFDWENYIYKVILGAQYVNDNISSERERLRYYELIVENLDLYNYIIKYEIFRNDKFLVNIMSIIDELQLSKVMKAKIKGREDLGDDERIGRRVIFEFNKSYPVVMSPMLDKEELKVIFKQYLSYYYDMSAAYPAEEHAINKTNATTHTPIPVSSFNGTSFGTNDPSRDNMGADMISGNDSGSQVAQLTTQAKKLDKETEPDVQDELLAYLDKHNLEYIDHRSKGGSLWVIGNKRIKSYLKPLNEKGIHFKFKPRGGKASKYKPAWFLK